MNEYIKIHMDLVKVRPRLNKRSRCGDHGKQICCGRCGNLIIVYHLSWSAIRCGGCDTYPNKEEFHDMGNIKTKHWSQ